jgi:hypothetical protein
MSAAYQQAVKTGKPSIEKVTVKRVVDESPDLSCIGEYSDNATDWSIERESGEYVADLPEDHETPTRGREYRYFTPYAGGETPGTADYREYGLQDFKRMESLNRGDWCMIGIVAEAEVLIPSGPDSCHVQHITGGSLWGIESDSDNAFLETIARECLGELQQQLEAIGISASDIAAAMPQSIEFKDC